MSQSEDLARAQAGLARLKTWLLLHAVPLWRQNGVDEVGVFHETLGQDGVGIDQPRRARVPPRQLYALATAQNLGAAVDDTLLCRGLKTFMARHLRSDGLVRAVTAGDGAVLDDTALLYDQAFVLLALASLRARLGPSMEERALALRSAMFASLGRAGGGFETATPSTVTLCSNPHMHLLEACLAWIEAGGDEAWSTLSYEIVRLAMTRFIDPDSGALREFFDEHWRPAKGLPGRIIEPGHHFEWGWLLLRWSERFADQPLSISARVVAGRLLEIGETVGVDRLRNVAINSLLEDFAIHDDEARLWPQTERIKAWALASVHEGGRYWSRVVEAIEGLELYLDTPVRGLWFDRLARKGVLVDAPAPASSFYHIVCAIDALRLALNPEAAG